MTLTDFLLARIAEDVEFAECVDPLAVFNRAHILAECEAKREIAECAASPETGDAFTGDQGDYYAGKEAGLEYAARLLAAIHADHPDYRQEWKP